MSANKHYYTRLTMALDDLLKAKRYADKMLKLPMGESFSEERTIYESLTVSLIISYGRVFTTSNTTNKEFKATVSSKFGALIHNKIIKKLEVNLEKLHKRIIEKRDTSIAHSDATSRNYQYYNDSPLAIGRNPFYPMEYDEIKEVIKLIEIIIDKIGDEQTVIGKIAFKNPLFKST